MFEVCLKVPAKRLQCYDWLPKKKKKKKKKKSFSIINYTASPLLWGARWMDWELKRSHARICCIFGGGSEMWRRCTLAPTCVTDVQVRCATNKRLSCKMWCSQAWMEITQQSGIEKGNRAMTMWFQHAQKKKKELFNHFYARKNARRIWHRHLLPSADVENALSHSSTDAHKAWRAVRITNFSLRWLPGFMVPGLRAWTWDWPTVLHCSATIIIQTPPWFPSNSWCAKEERASPPLPLSLPRKKK